MLPSGLAGRVNVFELSVTRCAVADRGDFPRAEQSHSIGWSLLLTARRNGTRMTSPYSGLMARGKARARGLAAARRTGPSTATSNAATNHQAPAALATDAVNDQMKFDRLIQARKLIGASTAVVPQRGDLEGLRSEYAYACEPSARSVEPVDLVSVPARLEPSASASEVYTRLHAILRQPRRFLKHERPDDHELVVRVNMTPDAYREMYASLRESDAWRAERVMIENQFSEGALFVPEVKKNQERYHIGVGTIMRAQFGREIVTFHLATTLAKHSDAKPSALTLAREVYGKKYAADLEPPHEMLNADETVRWGTREHSPIPPPVYPTTHHLLGPDYCKHTDAEWRLRSHYYASHLVLTCLRCFRGRLAIRPAVMDSEKGREMFRKEQMAQQILTGAPFNDDLEALIAASRAIPSDPEAYEKYIDLRTTKKPAPPEAQATQPCAIRTIRDVMGRR